MNSVLGLARTHLARIPGSEEHQALFDVACVLIHGFNLSIADSIPILREWSANCKLSWSVEDLFLNLQYADRTTLSTPRGHLISDYPATNDPTPTPTHNHNLNPNPAPNPHEPSIPEPAPPPIHEPLPEVPSETSPAQPCVVMLPEKHRDVYFDFHRRNYCIQTGRAGWISVNETNIKRYLRASGVSASLSDGCHISPLEERLLTIQESTEVHYAAPLAGWQAGVYTINEKRILVTESPKFLKPAPGEWPTLTRLLDGLLLDGDCDQRPYLYGWLKVGLEAFCSGQRRPGQALALCGPHDCGKSLLQNLITCLFGGRVAKPFQYMTGRTPFNADLFEAEHLMIEDDRASMDIRARRNFGAHLKNITVNETQRCHPKHKNAITLTPFWRITITLNHEQDNLKVLPPLDDSIRDKLILLRAYKKPMPMPTNTNEERRAFWSALVQELPAFLHFLEQWTIPSELRSARFGIVHFPHPELITAIASLSPEERLLQVLDLILFHDPAAGPYNGSADYFQTLMTKYVPQATKFLPWPGAFGTYLGRLSRKYPDRFVFHRTNSSRLWTIHPPR